MTPSSLATKDISSSPRQANRDCDRIFVRDLVLDCSVGIYDQERASRQRVRFNIEVDVAPRVGPTADEIGEVLSYETIVKGVKALAAGPHINLVETLAERVAEICLRDRRALLARISIEKLEVEPCAQSVGVEIVRRGTC